MQVLIRLFLIGLCAPVCCAESTLEVISKKTRENGVREYEIKSSLQTSHTHIRVLLPDTLKLDHDYPVVYVLPVEARRESRYGDGLTEILQQDLHNKHQVIFVAPTFSELPWYADHPTQSNLKQESYFTQDVVPFVEERFPTIANKDGRLLLGFSKSGWGAWTLLLRHPDMFGKAAAWDAPLMMKEVGRYGNGPIFGTQENFADYRLDRLLERVDDLGDHPRLILTGYGNFRQHHQQMQKLLSQRKIQHMYRDGPKRIHDWHSGWVVESVQLLME